MLFNKGIIITWLAGIYISIVVVEIQILLGLLYCWWALGISTSCFWYIFRTCKALQYYSSCELKKGHNWGSKFISSIRKWGLYALQTHTTLVIWFVCLKILLLSAHNNLSGICFNRRFSLKVFLFCGTSCSFEMQHYYLYTL